MLDTNSCEFNYEKYFDIVASIPPSPPLLAVAPDQDVVVDCGHSAAFNINIHEQQPAGKSEHHLMNISHQYKDVVGGVDIVNQNHDDDQGAIVVVDEDDEKRMRRKVSNREASKRARDRKQAQLAQLKSRLTELKLNNSSLSKRFADITHKYEGAAEENVALKERVDKLRKLVNVGQEEAFKAILESNHRFIFPTATAINIPPQTTSHPDLEIFHQLADHHKYNMQKQPNHQQTTTTSTTEFHSFLTHTTPTAAPIWDMSSFGHDPSLTFSLPPATKSASFKDACTS